MAPLAGTHGRSWWGRDVVVGSVTPAKLGPPGLILGVSPGSEEGGRHPPPPPRSSSHGARGWHRRKIGGHSPRVKTSKARASVSQQVWLGAQAGRRCRQRALQPTGSVGACMSGCVCVSFPPPPPNACASAPAVHAGSALPSPLLLFGCVFRTLLCKTQVFWKASRRARIPRGGICPRERRLTFPALGCGNNPGTHPPLDTPSRGLGTPSSADPRTPRLLGYSSCLLVECCQERCERRWQDQTRCPQGSRRCSSCPGTPGRSQPTAAGCSFPPSSWKAKPPPGAAHTDSCVSPVSLPWAALPAGTCRQLCRLPVPRLGGGVHGAASRVVPMGDPPTPQPQHTHRLTSGWPGKEGEGRDLAPTFPRPNFSLGCRCGGTGTVPRCAAGSLGTWLPPSQVKPLIGAQGRCWGCFGAELWRFGRGRRRGCAERQSVASVQGVRGALHLTGVQCQPGWWLQEWGAWHRTGGLVLLMGWRGAKERRGPW